jgi:hypothetical protein
MPCSCCFGIAQPQVRNCSFMVRIKQRGTLESGNGKWTLEGSKIPRRVYWHSVPRAHASALGNGRRSSPETRISIAQRVARLDFQGQTSCGPLCRTCSAAGLVSLTAMVHLAHSSVGSDVLFLPQTPTASDTRTSKSIRSTLGRYEISTPRRSLQNVPAPRR